MKSKVNKTIMNFQIKSFEFYKRTNWRLNKEVITGFIWLSDNKRIQIQGSEFQLINSDNAVEGMVLKSNPSYKRIKRIIARWFSSYRKNGSCQHVGYWRSRVIDGLHNINLFRISQISFKNNRSNFLQLAS
jgi:hypothetical protein